VYGITFPDKEGLKEYLHRMEEAKRRDHRNVGTQMELFFFHQLSPGSCFFLPNGARIYNTLMQVRFSPHPLAPGPASFCPTALAFTTLSGSSAHDSALLYLFPPSLCLPVPPSLSVSVMFCLLCESWSRPHSTVLPWDYPSPFGTGFKTAPSNGVTILLGSHGPLIYILIQQRSDNGGVVKCRRCLPFRSGGLRDYVDVAAVYTGEVLGVRV
jgi:hypothetical protein